MLASPKAKRITFSSTASVKSNFFFFLNWSSLWRKILKNKSISVTMIRTSSSSSSTLSPLAPPFTVDTHRYRYPPPPPTTLPEFNVNGSFKGGEALPFRSVDKSSSWLDPSVHYNASSLSADGYGTWHGNHSDSTAFHAKTGAVSSTFRANIEAGSSAFRERTEADLAAWQGSQTIYDKKKTDSINSEYSYFQLPNPNPVVQECHISNPNSSYDRYISELVTSSSDSFAYYPPENRLSSAQIYPPANRASSPSYLVPKDAYQSTERGTLFYDVDDNYLDYMLLNKTQPANNQYIDYREDYVRECITNSKNKGNNGVENSSVAAVCSSSGDEVTTDVKHNFAAKQMNFTESVSPSVISSAEYFDQPNQNEDSPCWKGASKFKECPFGRVEDVNHYDEAKESEISVGLHQERKCIAVGSQCMKTLVDVCFSGIDKAKGLECVEVASIVPDKNNERKDLTRDSEAQNIIMTQPIHERTATLSTNGPILHESSQNKLFDPILEADDHVRNILFPGAILDQVSNPVDTTVPSAACLKGRKDIMHLVKAMHNISEALLSSSFDSVADWEESDHELIKLVIANLESFASRNKKDATLCTSAENNFNIRSRGSPQEVSAEDLESAVFNKESNPHVLLYKNLWMQAEAALCSLKYELQLTRMKLEMENFEHEKKVMNSVQVTKSPIPKTPQLFDMLEHTTSPLACNHDPIPIQNGAISDNYEPEPKEQKFSMKETVESSIMARLEILRGRYAQSDDNSNTEQTRHSATETMFKDFADLGFVENRLPQQLDGDGNKDVNMAPGSFLHNFSTELGVYL